MYQSRCNELKKLMKIMNELSEEISIIKKDINNKNENQSKQLVLYIEEEIKQNINSIKELENPFLLFIMGSGNYGKSTLINALLQDKIIETSDIPNTWKLDMFIKSDNEKLKIIYNNEKEIIKSLSSGKMLLKEEDNKLKVSKLEISKKILSYKNNLSKEKLKEFKQKMGRKRRIIPVSAITGEGLDKLKQVLYDTLSKLPPVKPLEFEEFNYVKPDRLDYEIFKEGETFVIEGTLVEVLKRNVVLDDMNSLAYFHKVLRDRGIIKQLRQMGATDKSTIIIGGEEFEFVD
jgi:Obg family GTPase CgtA-like protein